MFGTTNPHQFRVNPSPTPVLFKSQLFSLLVNFTNLHDVKIIIDFNFISNTIIFAKTANGHVTQCYDKR